jgi:hypothetical protein
VSDLPRMADLMAIAKALDERAPGSRLSAGVHNARRVQSCIADLSLAATTLEALGQLQERRGWAPAVHQVAAEHALLANAIFLYARATATGSKSGERGHTSVRERLSSEDQQNHDRIVDIRNIALAHVRPNELIGDELWHIETVFAVETGTHGWVPAAMTRRVQANPSLAAVLRSLLPKAEALLKETYHRRLNYVAQQMNDAADTMPLFEEHLLDPVHFFGSLDEARRALSRAGPGARSYGVIDVPPTESAG